ncbi:hypothetical protein N9L47_08590 [Rhodobacteraceae bacterium]|nr:hypothetical protein [Paracoccaceae bacterium]
MTNAAANKLELATDNGTNVTRARFEPIKKILRRCDEKTIERARTMSAAAA